MRVLDHLCRHMRLDWAFEKFICLTRTQTLVLTVQETVELHNPWGLLWPWLWQFLMNMGGQILGYNSCPCSIFLDLRMQIGWRAFRNPRVEDDWTLECPEICAHIVAVIVEWAYRCHLEIAWIGWWAYRCHAKRWWRVGGLIDAIWASIA